MSERHSEWISPSPLAAKPPDPALRGTAKTGPRASYFSTRAGSQRTHGT